MDEVAWFARGAARLAGSLAVVLVLRLPVRPLLGRESPRGSTRGEAAARVAVGASGWCEGSPRTLDPARYRSSGPVPGSSN